MSDFFNRLAARTLGLAPVARPAVKSRFEPAEPEPGGIEELTVESKAAPRVLPEPSRPAPVEALQAREAAELPQPPKPTPRVPEPEIRRMEQRTIERRVEPPVANPPAVPPVPPPAPPTQPAVPGVPPVITRERETVLVKTELLREKEVYFHTESHTLEAPPTTAAPRGPQPPIPVPAEQHFAAAPKALPTRLPKAVSEPRRPEPMPRRQRDPQPAPVHITIGRVEVRPVQPRAEMPKLERKGAHGPVLPLDRYLKEQG